MKFEILVAFTIAFTGSAHGLTLPYQDCTSGTCVTKNTQIVADGLASLGGVSVSGTALTMSPNRLYLTNEAGGAYEPFKLKNRKLLFTTDVSKVPCGGNAAFYFSGMSFQSSVGSGYCDAQISCNEMDIFEGNIGAQAFTPHPCLKSDQSNSPSQCSSWGVGKNTHAFSNIGPSYSGIDVTKPFTVTTTFTTSDGTDSGSLSSISQTYMQGSNSVDIGTVTESDFLALPSAQYGGGMSAMSAGLDAGMVFVLSLWGTVNTNAMSWLDYYGSNSKCDVLSGMSSESATFSDFKLTTISDSSSNSGSSSSSGSSSGSSGNSSSSIDTSAFSFASGSAGKVMYAFGCDWTDGDIANVAKSSDLCGDACAEYSGCTHFTWTAYNGGTCWLKDRSVKALVSTSSAGAVCGYTV